MSDKQKAPLESNAVRFSLAEKEWDDLDTRAADRQWSRNRLVMNYVREGLAREAKK